jgi:hypothetical protein
MTKNETLNLTLEFANDIQRGKYKGNAETIITAIKAALEAKCEPVVWNEGVPAMLPKQKEGETFIVSYEPKQEAKDEPFGYFRYDLRLDAWVQNRDSNQGVAFYTTPPQQEAKDEPVAWSELQKAADLIVKEKFLYKRFIDGTPLANDISCWMATFAQEYTTQSQRKPLSDEELTEIFSTTKGLDFYLNFARAIEAAHGIIDPADLKGKYEHSKD